MQTLEDFFTITNTDCISEIDSYLPSLLGTYTLVKWMEIVSAKLANKNIDDGFLTVGQEVCIEHKGMGKIGQKVKIVSKMIETSKRTMKFDIFATINDKLIASAKHTRIIISKKVIDRQLRK
jgi:predicted thioesterase